MGGEFIKELVSNNYAIKKDMIKINEELLKRLTLLEMEGKFEINRQGLTLPPEERLRNDKALSININQIEGIEEYIYLHKLIKLIYCVPFELNLHAPWLQL